MDEKISVHPSFDIFCYTKGLAHNKFFTEPEPSLTYEKRTTKSWIITIKINKKNALGKKINKTNKSSWIVTIKINKKNAFEKNNKKLY